MHGYEVIYGDAVRMILNKTIGLSSYTNLAYPPLVFWIMAVAFLVLFIPLGWFLYLVTHFQGFLELFNQGLAGEINFWVHLDQIFNKEILGIRYWQNAMYWGRYITAIFGTGSIFLIYKVVMEYFDKKIMALTTAFLLAINYRLVLNSHMGFFDIYNVFFLLLALFAFGKLLKSPKMVNYIFAALYATIAFLVKYQPSAFIALGITHLIISAKNSKKKFSGFVKNLFNSKALISGIVVVIIFLIAHIDYFLRIKEVLGYSPWVWTANEFHKFKLYLFPLSYVYYTGLGPALTIISIAGIFLGFFNRRYRKQTTILVAPIIVSFYLFTYFSAGGYYTYNLLIPISVMLIFASLFLGQTSEWFVRKRVGSIITTSIYLLVLTFVARDHIFNSVLSTYILAQPSYRITAEDWLNKNIKGPVVLATHTSGPRIQKNNVEIVDLPNLPEIYGFREFVQEGYDYALIDFFKIQEKNFWWMLSPPRMPTQFWGKPNDLLAQNYLALATRELLWSHTIKSFLPKWQASGYNYIVTAIKPPMGFEKKMLVTRFDFEDASDWTPLFFLEKDKEKLFWSEEGREIKGAIAVRKSKETHNKSIEVATIPGGIRWESGVLPAKPGFGYKVTGWIKNAEYTDKKFRNGFLRLDFYKVKNKPSITSRPIISFVSARPYGESKWHQVEIQATAPFDANFLKIAFQADDSTVAVFLDEVEIYETKDQPEEIEVEHYIIPDEDFFRPSDGSFT